VVTDDVTPDPVVAPVDPPQGPQTPLVLPGAVMQVSPRQQSALVVHCPHVATHVPGPP